MAAKFVQMNWLTRNVTPKPGVFSLITEQTLEAQLVNSFKAICSQMPGDWYEIPFATPFSGN